VLAAGSACSRAAARAAAAPAAARGRHPALQLSDTLLFNLLVGLNFFIRKPAALNI